MRSKWEMWFGYWMPNAKCSMVFSFQVLMYCSFPVLIDEKEIQTDWDGQNGQKFDSKNVIVAIDAVDNLTFSLHWKMLKNAWTHFA